MEVNEVKEHAKELKQVIESAIKSFRDTTGYNPNVTVETVKKPTNDKTFYSHKVTVTVEI